MGTLQKCTHTAIQRVYAGWCHWIIFSCLHFPTTPSTKAAPEIGEPSDTWLWTKRRKLAEILLPWGKQDRFESKALLIELLRWYVLLSTCSEAILWASWSQSNCAAASAVLCPLEELLRTAQQEVSGTNLLKSSLPASLLRQSSAHETC